MDKRPLHICMTSFIAAISSITVWGNEPAPSATPTTEHQAAAATDTAPATVSYSIPAPGEKEMKKAMPFLISNAFDSVRRECSLLSRPVNEVSADEIDLLVKHLDIISRYSSKELASLHKALAYRASLMGIRNADRLFNAASSLATIRRCNETISDLRHKNAPLVGDSLLQPLDRVSSLAGNYGNALSSLLDILKTIDKDVADYRGIPDSQKIVEENIAFIEANNKDKINNFKAYPYLYGLYTGLREAQRKDATTDFSQLITRVEYLINSPMVDINANAIPDNKKQQTSTDDDFNTMLPIAAKAIIDEADMLEGPLHGVTSGRLDTLASKLATMSGYTADKRFDALHTKAVAMRSVVADIENVKWIFNSPVNVNRLGEIRGRLATVKEKLKSVGTNTRQLKYIEDIDAYILDYEYALYGFQNILDDLTSKERTPENLAYVSDRQKANIDMIGGYPALKAMLDRLMDELKANPAADIGCYIRSVDTMLDTEYPPRRHRQSNRCNK